MEGAKLVSNLIESQHPKTILDLGAGKGYFSILAASYGAQVDAVEDTSIRNHYPDYLKAHPSINFHESPLADFKITKKYDLIIAKHIVMYMNKEYVLGEFISSIYEHLNRGGFIFLTYHHSDSHLMKENEDAVRYTLDDFKYLRHNFSIKDFGDYTNPAPGINKEYKIGYIILQKN
ncbi:class I SAM-dependent methyltransferase [Candidatus Gracilibacteria bacterium]|nr:class I SAM-dependent methyltransferase [candidate division SR1 bacterium]MBF0981788.1 class I SAM-dependent methyltransferase [Candidatus Gracilibacteria bacterium]